MDQYASSVLDHISTTIDSVTTQKQITMYPNQKPWMNRDVPPPAEGPQHRLQTTRQPAPPPTSSDVSFLNELNNFYARFERGNTATATKAAVTPDHQPQRDLKQ
ncbi:hypothetical protein L3Q82_026084, partial [Scortum barcoo]